MDLVYQDSILKWGQYLEIDQVLMKSVTEVLMQTMVVELQLPKFHTITRFINFKKLLYVLCSHQKMAFKINNLRSQKQRKQFNSYIYSSLYQIHPIEIPQQLSSVKQLYLLKGLWVQSVYLRSNLTSPLICAYWVILNSYREAICILNYLRDLSSLIPYISPAYDLWE